MYPLKNLSKPQFFFFKFDTLANDNFLNNLSFHQFDIYTYINISAFVFVGFYSVFVGWHFQFLKQECIRVTECDDFEKKRSLGRRRENL